MKQQGFGLITLMAMGMIFGFVLLTISQFAKTQSQATVERSNVLWSDIEKLSFALEKHYLVSCATGAVNQSDLVGKYLTNNLAFPGGNNYSLAIVGGTGSAKAVISIELIGESKDLAAQIPVVHGAEFDGTTIVYEHFIQRNGRSLGRRIQAEANLFGSYTC